MWYFVFLGVLAISFYFYRKWAGGGVCAASVDLTDKVVIITGGNAGIGYQTAKGLLSMNAHIVLACRDSNKGREAVRKLKNEVGKSSIEFMKLDLASLASVREFAQAFKEKHSTLHILINNAGVMMCPQSETEDGFEMQFGTNHLGHFLLTLLLIGHMKESGSGGRIINVASKASIRKVADIHFDDINMTKIYTPYSAYAQSKLANVLFTEELHRRLKDSGITTYSLHPGVVATELIKYQGKCARNIANSSFVFVFPVKTPWQGAQTSLYTTTAPDIEKHSGGYFADCKVVKNPNPLSGNEEVAQKLWKLSEELVKETWEL